MGIAVKVGLAVDSICRTTQRVQHTNEVALNQAICPQ